MFEKLAFVRNNALGHEVPAALEAGVEKMSHITRFINIVITISVVIIIIIVVFAYPCFVLH